jgi:hypothetical protein
MPKDDRIWEPHLDYAGEPMQPGHFRDSPNPDTRAVVTEVEEAWNASRPFGGQFWHELSSVGRDRLVALCEQSRIAAEARVSAREGAIKAATDAAKVAEVCAILATRYDAAGNAEIANYGRTNKHRVAAAYEAHLVAIRAALHTDGAGS